jgi:uncharacterized membrane protein YeaQ/YmgE (transglycosylase-associated protein family)
VITYLFWVAVSGLFIGALGRLAIPGRQPMGCLMTILVGIAGSLLGGLVGEALFNRPGGFILAVLCSAGIVFVISRVTR